MQNKNGSAKFGGAVFLFLGMVFFGSATPVSKLVGKEMDPILITGLRMLLAGLALLPFALYKEKALFKLKKKEWLQVLVVAVIGNIGFTMFMLFGMKMISGVAGSIIMSLTPAITATGAILFLHEKLNWQKIVALALGLAGVLIMHISGSGSPSGNNDLLLGSLLVFAAICCEATYTLVGKVATEALTPLKLATLSALLAGVLLLP